MVASRDRSSRIFIEASQNEISMMHEEEHSVFGRMLHQLIEVCSEDIEELIYVAQVLRENQGLLILLVGGVSSMMMALIAGLDEVNVLKALLLSTTCYGVTTLLVARAARRTANQRVSMNGEPKLSSAELSTIINSMPEEKFVPNNELESCDLMHIENMLHSRRIVVSQIAGAKTKTKKNMVNELRQNRKYSESCCVCLCSFDRGESIRVLDCLHEFHLICIDKWAGTFVSKGSNCNSKRGLPTCPLCNTSFGNAQVPAMRSHS